MGSNSSHLGGCHCYSEPSSSPGRSVSRDNEEHYGGSFIPNHDSSPSAQEEALDFFPILSDVTEEFADASDDQFPHNISENDKVLHTELSDDSFLIHNTLIGDIEASTSHENTVTSESQVAQSDTKSSNTNIEEQAGAKDPASGEDIQIMIEDKTDWGELHFSHWSFGDINEVTDFKGIADMFRLPLDDKWKPHYEADIQFLVKYVANPNLQDKESKLPLNTAAEHGLLEFVQILVENGEDLNTKDIWGRSPIDLASTKGFLECARFLKEHGAAPRVPNGTDPLFGAAHSGDLELAELLLKNTPYLNFQNKEGWTPLYASAREGHLGCVKLLVKHAADPNIPHNEGRAPLHAACFNGNVECVQFLMEIGADLNMLDIYGRTPFFVAAENGNLEAVEFLLKHTPDLNFQNKEGWTPLYASVREGHLGCVKLLVKHTADPNIPHNEGRASLHAACFNGNVECVQFLMEVGAELNMLDQNGCTALSIATHWNHLKCIKFLVQQKAYLNHADKDGETPLFEAAKNGYLESVEFLVKHTQSVNLQNIHGWTPLYASVREGHLGCVKLLVKHTADPNIPHNEGNASLHAACFNGNVECVKFLMEIGAELDMLNIYGRTPLWMAVCWNHFECLKYLVQQKANLNIRDGHGSTLQSVAKGLCLDYLKLAEFIQLDVKKSLLEKSRSSSEFVQKIYDHLEHQSGSSVFLKESLKKKFDVSVDCRKYFVQNAKKVAIVMTVDKNRPGNNMDVDRILKILPEWGYDKIINVKNFTKRQIIDTLVKLQKLDGIYHGLLIFIACHGLPGNVLITSDKKTVTLAYLKELVNSEYAPAFSGVPKLFIISACRGEDEIQLEQTAEEAIVGVCTDVPHATLVEPRPSVRVNSETDFFTAYSTVNGFVSFRDRDKGTYFIQILLDIWIQHFNEMRLLDLMQKTRIKLIEEVKGHQVCETGGETLMYPVVRGVYEMPQG